MPFNRPDLATLRDRIMADIRSRLPGAAPELRRTLLGVLAHVEAGAVHGLYGYLEWLSRQLMVDTSGSEWLDRHASIWGVARKAASYAAGTVAFTGSGSVPAGRLLQRADGAQFTTDAAITAPASVAVTASLAGLDGNSAAASTLAMVSPLAGINGTVTIDGSGITGGTDAETDDALRSRLLARIQEPPHGGAAADYVTWAMEVAGVTRAWVYAQELGIGTVSVRFMMDDVYTDGIPQAADVTAVQAYIDALRPVTAAVTVVAPVAVPLDMTIALTPTTAAVKAAVEAEIADMIARDAVPGGTILISRIREAISIAVGETDHVLSVPSADVIHTAGQIATMGTVTWL